MAMQALRDGASKGILKFFLLGILCLAGGGLVFTDVGGFFRGGGVSGTDVAKVGKDSIGINSFDRVARRTLAQLGITPQQAYKLGYLNQILGSEIQRRTLMRAANESSISVGQDYVVNQIQTILSPAMASGLSAEEALDNLLRSQGISEGELSTTILSERTLGLFGDAMEAGALYTPKALASEIYAFDNESRDIRYISFMHKDFEGIEPPSDEQLKELYEKTKEQFASPERRDVQVVTIKTDAIGETLEIQEQELRDIYENEIDLYTDPASRSVTQALFTTEDDANKALESITGANFEKAAKDAKADIIPARAFSEADILDELKEPVFNAENTGIIGPIETPLGWTLLNLSKIQDESVKPFDSVKKEIREDLIQERLINEIYKLVDEVDEVFAIGASVEEAKEQFELSIESFNSLDRSGQNENGESPLNPAFGPDAQNILESLFELDEGTTGPAFEIADGRFIVVNNAKTSPKTYQAFEDVKGNIETQWISDQLELSNRMEVINLQKEQADASIETIAKNKGKNFKTIAKVKRDDDQSPLSQVARNSIFGAKQGEHFLIEIRDGVALAEVTKVNKAGSLSDKSLTELQNSTQQNMQNELLTLYMNSLYKNNRPKVNERLLEQVYGEQNENSGAY